MPRKTSRRKPTRKTSRRKPTRKTARRKSTRKTSRRKSTRKTSRRKPTRKTSGIKSPTTTRGGNEYLFSVWYVNKPKVNNKLTVINPTVKLDDDNEWIFSGFVKANSLEEAKTWLRSLGSIKKYTGTSEERLDITVFQILF
jgi:hypothetical protein